MDRITRRRLEERAGVIKAMAHPTRLFLVEQLATGERCVCELTDGVGADISTVSRHLDAAQTRRDRGVGEARPEGLLPAAHPVRPALLSLHRERAERVRGGHCVLPLLMAERTVAPFAAGP